MNLTDVPTLNNFLSLVMSGAIIGPTVAFVAEYWKWFQARSANFKWWSIFVFCLLAPTVAFIAAYFMGYVAVPIGVKGWIEEIFFKVGTGAFAWWLSQQVHLSQRKTEATIKNGK